MGWGLFHNYLYFLGADLLKQLLKWLLKWPLNDLLKWLLLEGEPLEI
jgi:hypothetical protein